MVYCQKCNSWNNDKNNFCGNCGAKLVEPANYCPDCDLSFHNAENFCTVCGKKLVVKSKWQDKPVDPGSYILRYDVKKDSPVVDDRSKGAEFTEGKTDHELEEELDFVTAKLEDCQKSGDYMMSYYKEKKRILENALRRY